MKKLATIFLLFLLTGMLACSKQSIKVPTDASKTSTTNIDNSGSSTATMQVTQALVDSSYTVLVGDTKIVDGTDANYGADALTNITLQNKEGSKQDSGCITLFDYVDEEAAATAVKGFDPDDPSIFNVENKDGTTTGVIVDYVAPITLWQLDNSIVLYCGDDDALCMMLTDAFGEPFASTTYNE